MISVQVGLDLAVSRPDFLLLCLSMIIDPSSGHLFVGHQELHTLFWSPNGCNSCTLSVFSPHRSEKREYLLQYLLLESWDLLFFTGPNWLTCCSLNQSLGAGWHEDQSLELRERSLCQNHVAEIGVEINSPNEKQGRMERREENGHLKG